jgi:hypothetical protein
LSQSDFGVIDPNTKSGTQLAVDLNGFRDAVNSGHSGATRPAYLPAGGHWVRIVSSTQWDLVMYDGAVNYTLRSINPTTGQKIGIPAADLADKQTSANDNTAGRLLVNPAYGLGTTGALSLPSGTTANRPASPAQFDSRGNSTTGAPEWWSGSAWVPFSGIDYLNTTRIDVASAATVDLTSLAPNTRHINLTGAVAVTGFTVAAGQTYFVRLNGATLTNNANIVTNTGANIVSIAGDTCALEATAANTVAVSLYSRVQKLTVGTAQNTTSGTAIDFTGLPSWVRRITVAVQAVSTSGTSNPIIQLGTSGGIDAASYTGSIWQANTTNAANSTGFLLNAVTAAANSLTALITLMNVSGNIWAASVTGSYSPPVATVGGGAKSLGATLDRIRLTTVNGTDTFDAGSVNIIYEG